MQIKPKGKREVYVMELQEVIKKAKDKRKGAFVCIEYYANPYTLAAGRDKNIVKKCKGVYRLGINYSHLKANANKETGGLNGKVWKDGDVNYILQSEKTGEYMLRVYTTHTATRSEWTINGEKTTKAELVEQKLVSDRKSSQTACFDIKISNIIAIG